MGSLADRYGRKLNCLIFVVLYSISCLTKHSPDFNVLMVGRLLGGVSTSILYSAFETWMIHEHKGVRCVVGVQLYCHSTRAPGAIAPSFPRPPPLLRDDAAHAMVVRSFVAWL